MNNRQEPSGHLILQEINGEARLVLIPTTTTLTPEEQEARAEKQRIREAELAAQARKEAEDNLDYLREVRAFLEAYKAAPEQYPFLTPRVLDALTDWNKDYSPVLRDCVWTDDYDFNDLQEKEFDEVDDLLGEILEENGESE